MAESSSVFDMIGPVMIGPSSSHTAGVVRIGKVAAKLLMGTPDSAEIVFYNSFARTYEGHGSDRAVIAGLLGYNTDDIRIRDSFEQAKSKGLKYSFRAVGNASTLHPNSVKITASINNNSVQLIGESRGGGVVCIVEVNGFESNFSASMHTLIIMAKDVKGSIAYISNVLSHDDCNIATMTVSRRGKHDQACLIFEMDSGLRDLTLKYLNSLSWILSVTYIPIVDL